MSKKKVSGSTMTLKDFHGGSIPTDLPLPSAPGVIIRHTDRSGYERPSTWGNTAGRSDHRSRPHTSPAIKHFDDKAPFLAHSAHIGRNFDEDERKPLDGVSAPRRTISDESFQVPPARVELKPESAPIGCSLVRQGRVPTSSLPSGMGNSYSGGVNESAHVGANSQNLDGSVGQGVGGTYPNAWAARKGATGVTERVQSVWSAPSAVSKLAHASALEKVSSGRWQSKHSVQDQSDVEVIRSADIESGLDSKVYSNITHGKMDAISGSDHHDVNLARHTERSLTIDDHLQAGRREVLDYEMVRIPVNSEEMEINPTGHFDWGQPDHVGSKFVGSELQTSVHSEPSERPKLKLLPRTRPVEILGSPEVDHAQGYQPATLSGHTEAFSEVHGNINLTTIGLGCTNSVKQTLERPKMNLKPRSQPLEQVERIVERDRHPLFGGARPRELVLKERGISDVVITKSEKVEYDVRSDRVSGNANTSRYSGKNENFLMDQRTGKRSERREHQVDTEKREHQVDIQRRNWRNENRKSRETERQHQQPDRPPSPETWRKPVEQAKQTSDDAAGVRYGKVASAVDLAQAFSRSVSDSKSDHHSSPRSLPGQSQMPFSRLMGRTSRPQINGY